MTFLEMCLPIHTVSEKNVREHWSQKSRRVHRQRQAVAMALAGPLQLARVHITDGRRLEVYLTRIAPRELDDDNLIRACSGCRDGVADALRLRSDRDDRVRWLYAQRRGSKPREYAVEIRVESEPS